MLKLAVILGLLFALSFADREQQWKDFKSKHQRKYKDQQEEAKRRLIWENNLNLITKHNDDYNKGLKTFTLAENKYSDLTRAEFVQTLNGYKDPTAVTGNNNEGKRSLLNDLQKRAVTVPSIDYRTLGYVAPVEDQGYCGSCWAFSALGALEGQVFKKYKQLVPLSKQNLVDCAGRYGNNGCNGGWMSYAYNYIKANGGIDTQASYPYTALDGTCKFNKATIGAKVTGYIAIAQNEETIANTVATVGPVAVAINADLDTFSYYSSGVYDDVACINTTSGLDHAVLIVGYGTTIATATEPAKDYWIVKNSWGTTWGEQGYIKMARGRNQCGIKLAAMYPIVA